MAKVQASHEKKRGCGFRFPGLYLESGEGSPNGVLPRFVVLRPESVPAEGPAFRCYRYEAGELWDHNTRDSRPVGADIAEIRQAISACGPELATRIEKGDPGWANFNWLLLRVNEETPRARVMLEARALASRLERAAESVERLLQLCQKGGY